MNELKIFTINIVSAVMAFLSPIKDFMTMLVVLFVVNFFCGLIADIVVGLGFSMKKAMQFFTHCFIFFGLVTFLYSCGYFMHNYSGAVQCVSYMCYMALWFYLRNIIRNLKGVVHQDTELWSILDLLHYILSFHFVEKIPYLADWQRRQSTKDNNQENQQQ